MNRLSQGIGTVWRWVRKHPILTVLGGVCGVPALGVVVLILLLSRPHQTFLAALLWGWWDFLARVLPRWELNPDLLAMAILCLVGMLWLSHVLLNWLLGHLGISHGAWKWRHTTAASAAFALLFLVGMSFVGMIHQTGWMLASREPWSYPISRVFFGSERYMPPLLSGIFEGLLSLKESQDESEGWKSFLDQPSSIPLSYSLDLDHAAGWLASGWETPLHLILRTDDAGQPKGLLAHYPESRDPRMQQVWLYHADSQSVEILPTLEEAQSRYPTPWIPLPVLNDSPNWLHLAVQKASESSSEP